MANRALSHLAVWAAGALSLLLLCARAACPELCECPRAQNVLCANRGLRVVPESSRSVRELGLAGNFIGNVSALALTRYEHLRRLDLQFNRIQHVHPKAFERLGELEELYLGHNLIQRLQPGTFGALKKLTVLYGNENHIRELRGDTFGRLESLVRLRLDKNELELLSESVFQHFSSLMFLQLESNRLRHIHRKTFSSLTKLQFLNLSDNKQTHLRDTSIFSQLRSLITLLLSGNQIKHIANYVFQNLRKLTKLSLSNNNIVRLENGTLKGLVRLRELAVNGNRLTQIQAGVLEPLKRIERLDFSDNWITRIDPTAFTRLTLLRILNLSNNRLRRISGGIFSSNAALFQLDLSGNEWKCDCRMEKLKEWMAQTRARGKLLTVLVRCHHPPTLEGKYLDQVNNTMLLAEQNGSNNCRTDDKKVLEAHGAGWQEPPGVTEGWLKREGEKQDDMGDQDAGRSRKKMKRKKKVKFRPRLAPSASAKTRSYSALLGTLTPNMFPLKENVSMWELNDALHSAGNQNHVYSMPQKHVEQYTAKSVEVTDACQFNHQYIMNVSAHNVTFNSATVSWSTPVSTHTLRDQTLMFRILFDRFGHPVRFPRYVYTDSSAQAVMLQELCPDSTYITCVESVVDGALCQVAPRDHCVGFLTMAPLLDRDIKLQHVTLAVLVTNVLLSVLVSGIWLGRVMWRKLKTRKSSTQTPVRRMYSMRRPFRSALATTCVSSEFSAYQRGRALADDGDLMHFPVDRFFDSSCTRRDDSVIPRLSN